jgi:hypothetical protein
MNTERCWIERENKMGYHSVTMSTANSQRLTQDLHCEKSKTNCLNYGMATGTVRVNCYEYTENSWQVIPNLFKISFVHEMDDVIDGKTWRPFVRWLRTRNRGSKVARNGVQNRWQVCIKTQATVSMSSVWGWGQTDKGTWLALSLPLRRLFGWFWFH